MQSQAKHDSMYAHIYRIVIEALPIEKTFTSIWFLQQYRQEYRKHWKLIPMLKLTSQWVIDHRNRVVLRPFTHTDPNEYSADLLG